MKNKHKYIIEVLQMPSWAIKTKNKHVYTWFLYFYWCGIESPKRFEFILDTLASKNPFRLKMSFLYLQNLKKMFFLNIERQKWGLNCL